MEIFIGALASLMTQLLKEKEWSDLAKIGAILGISLLLGIIYHFVYETAFWGSFLAILAYAGAIYTFILRRFEK